MGTGGVSAKVCTPVSLESTGISASLTSSLFLQVVLTIYGFINQGFHGLLFIFFRVRPQVQR